MPRKPNPDTILKKELKAAIDANDWEKAAKITAILKGESAPEPPRVAVESPIAKFITPRQDFKKKIPPPLDNEPFVDDGTLAQDLRNESKSQPVISKMYRGTSLVEVYCTKCHRDVVVSNKLTWGRDSEVGSEFICDDCLGRHRR